MDSKGVNTIQKEYNSKAQKTITSEPRIGPKVVIKKEFAKGRIPFRIKSFLQDNPTATLGNIKLALDLEVSTSTIGRYLKKIGFTRQEAKRRIVISKKTELSGSYFAG